ncbi:MAG: hypothetical protein BWX96_03107 [Bacteroidetes bacterium ADurb.Bin145]|nr:MAG: hypothetical protein BWX96_03107 [Bacteroidetes bacterium ADurb.Bin145]
MAKYTCKECNKIFTDEDPFLVQPICPNCKNQKNTASIKITPAASKGSTRGGLIFISVTLAIIFLLWGGCSGVFTYHDEIYVKDKLKTYSTEDFAPGAKNKNVDVVTFDVEDRITTEVVIYNKTTGEEKKISLALPIYQLRVRAVKNDFDTIVGYKQPAVYSGNSYIKTTDAILENSPEFTSAIADAKVKYIKDNAKEMKDWVFNKEEINKQ